MEASRPFLLVLLLAWSVLAVGAARAEPLAIVVDASWSEAREISLADLRAVYLGRRAELFGMRVRPIDLPSGSAIRAGFSRSVLGRSESALERYWIEQALMGGALPPLQVREGQDVLRAVRGDPGAIGYVVWSALATAGVDGVRVLRVVSGGLARAPEEAGYPIQLAE